MKPTLTSLAHKGKEKPMNTDYGRLVNGRIEYAPDAHEVRGGGALHQKFVQV